MNRTGTLGIVFLLGLALGFVGSAIGLQSAPSNRVTVTTIASVTVLSTATVGTQGTNGPQVLEYCFSPGGNCDQVLIKYINQAKTSIHIMIYDFTLTDIESALQNARSRGVEVKLVMDRSESQISGSLYADLKQKGFDVKIGNVAGIVHDKVAIIDGRYVIEGSFNYTYSAVADNAENLVVINDPQIAQAYQIQFQQLYSTGS
jgi:phospholipase D